VNGDLTKSGGAQTEIGFATARTFSIKPTTARYGTLDVMLLALSSKRLIKC